MMKYAITILLLAVGVVAQPPTAVLPQIQIDTTWNPNVATVRPAHTAAQLTAALSAAVPGDEIVLDAGVTYAGNFTLPAKVNPGNQWIYIVTGNFVQGHPQGTRVLPSDAPAMAKIVSPNSTTTLTAANGANYWWLAGVEITANAASPGCGSTGKPNCTTYFLANLASTSGVSAHHIYLDRVYAHGSPTQDLQGGLITNWDWAAVVDSYIEEIHTKGFDSVGVGCYHCLGPI